MRSGFGLAEVLVALTLLTVSAVGAVALAAASTRLLVQARLQERAATLGSMLLDSLADVEPGAATSRRADFDVVYTVAPDSAGGATFVRLVPVATGQPLQLHGRTRPSLRLLADTVH